MGSKRLKAIACSGSAPVQISAPEGFREAARRQIGFLDESMLKVVFDAFGTNMIADMVNVRGGYPTRNWQSGEFEQIEVVNAQGITDTVFNEGVRCFACPVIGCSMSHVSSTLADCIKDSQARYKFT